MDLTHTAEVTKKVIIIAIAMLFVSILIFIAYRLYKAYELANRPPYVEKPTLEFGDLPEPDFPESLVASSSLSYSLDTKTGELPPVDKVSRVYFMPKSFATLLASEKSAKLAEKFGIIGAEPQVLNETLYKYTLDDKNITVSLETQNFSYTQDILDKAKQRPLDDEAKLVDDFRSFLSSMGLSKEILKNGPDVIQLLKFDENGTPQAASREEAQGALISIWPSAIVEDEEGKKQKPIVTADPNKSLINAIVYSGARDLENYYSLNYTYWTIDFEEFATYPVKTSEEAFEELKNGDGVVVEKPAGKEVSIASVYLAYYEPDEYTPYLLPIFVFEGPDFKAYLSAIKTTPEEPEASTSP